MGAEQVGLTAVIAALVGALPIATKLVVDLLKARGQQKLAEQEGDLKGDEMALNAYRTMFEHQTARMDKLEAKLDLVVAAEADCRVRVADISAKADAAKAEVERAYDLLRSMGHRVNDIQQQIVLTEAARKIAPDHAGE